MVDDSIAKVLLLSTLPAVIGACNVPDPPAPTGGVHVSMGPCGRGVVVVESDYASTNVALAGFDGTVLSSSIVSSGTRSPGLSMALSGDVVAASARPASDFVVLIDRYPNAVLTWLDPETAEVRGQLSVATGFASNPHDYLEIGGGRAYVSRYESNPSPGREPWDGGGDLLVVSLWPPAIVGRVDLARPDDGPWLPRPDRMLLFGQHALVLLQRFDESFSSAGDGRIVGVSLAGDTVDWMVDMPGLASCGAMVLSPSRDRLAVACSGVFQDQAGQIDKSGVVLLDMTTIPPQPLRRYGVALDLGAPLAPAIGYLDDTHLVGVAYGDLVANRGDQVYSLDLSSGVVDVLSRSSQAFVLGDIRCASACGAPCLLADAERMALRRFALGATGAVDELPAALVNDAIGLPPRTLGIF